MTTLALAQLQRLQPPDFKKAADEAVECQLNPTEYTLTKEAQFAEIPIPGLDLPLLQFVRGQAERLTVDLFFDSTDDGMGDSARPVTEQTDKVHDLAKIDPTTHAPPVCSFSWGTIFPGAKPDRNHEGGNRQSFRCVVESVRQRFTLFNPAGMPLRATLSVSLREYNTVQNQLAEGPRESADHTHSHVVAEGDTLTRIAAAVYDDPRRWRLIADANRIDDPLALQPGSILVVPPGS